MDALRLHDTLKTGETAVVLVRPGNPTTARMALGVKRGLWMEAASQDADAKIDAFLAEADGPVFGSKPVLKTAWDLAHSACSSPSKPVKAR